MNKSELVAAIANKCGVTKKDTEEVLNTFMDVVKDALKAGDKVQLIGFGTFECKEHAARQGRNPRTGKTIEIPAHKSPDFAAGKALKDAVNE